VIAVSSWILLYLDLEFHVVDGQSARVARSRADWANSFEPVSIAEYALWPVVQSSTARLGRVIEESKTSVSPLAVLDASENVD
jgi:hypothetical protein